MLHRVEPLVPFPDGLVQFGELPEMLGPVLLWWLLQQILLFRPFHEVRYRSARAMVFFNSIL